MLTKIKKGFTLIELLVVISLIGILSTLVLANLNSARERSRDAQRKSDLRNIQTALRMYYNDVGSYPADAQLPAWGEKFSRGGTVYMNILPGDPVPGWSYFYAPDAANDSYTLFACFENKSDNKCDQDAGGNIVSCADGVGCLYSVKP